MHKKDYEMIAEVLRTLHAEEINDFPSVTLADVAYQLAIVFRKDNPNFKPFTFLDACSADPDGFPFSEMWEAQCKGHPGDGVTVYCDGSCA